MMMVMTKIRIGGGYGKAPGGATTALLDRLARKSPYYARNAPHLCSFFAKGNDYITCTFATLMHLLTYYNNA
jgi:hypothetical protein